MKRLLAAILFLSVPAFGQAVFFQASWTQSLGAVATPTFSPTAGAVGNPTTVTVSSTVPASGVTYCITQDGSTPTGVWNSCTNGTLATTTSVTSSTTVNAIGCATGYTCSAVGSAAYTIVLTMAVSQGTAASPITCGALNGVNTSGFTCPVSATSAGDTAVVACKSTASSFAITGGTLVGTVGSDAASQFWIVPNLTPGTTSLAATYTAGYKLSTCVVSVVSHIVASLPIDTSIGATNDSSASTGNASSATGSISTTNANDVVIGWGCFSVTPGTVTAGTGYTLMSGGNYSTSSYYCYMEFANQTSTGTYNPGMTWTNSLTRYMGTGAFKL